MILINLFFYSNKFVIFIIIIDSHNWLLISLVKWWHIIKGIILVFWNLVNSVSGLILKRVILMIMI